MTRPTTTTRGGGTIPQPPLPAHDPQDQLLPMAALPHPLRRATARVDPVRAPGILRRAPRHRRTKRGRAQEGQEVGLSRDVDWTYIVGCVLDTK